MSRAILGVIIRLPLLLAAAHLPLSAQGVSPRDSTERVADSVSLRIVNTELRAAVQLMGQYLDKPVVFTGPGSAVVTLETPQKVPRRDVVRLLRGLLESQGLQLVDDTTSGLYHARPRTATATPRDEPTPRTVSTRAARDDGPVLHVIPLQHARAADVASTISALYGVGSGAADATTGRPTLAEELRGGWTPPDLTGQSARPSASLRNVGATAPLTIVADPRANSLLVRASAADLALVREVVSALDVRPLQVLIEVLVAEVRRDRSLGINVNGELGQTTVGRNGTTVEGSFGPTEGLGDFALKVMGLGALDATATLSAASGRGTVRVLTRPVVLATNNQLAEIVVGSQRPFVQVSRSLPTDNASRDQVIQYRDVGTKLSVRPTISLDGSVQLEVTQEVSTATSELAFDAPVIATRSVRTQLLVRDGQTVSLGGLTDRQRESRQGGVPILSAIPILGGLFGRASRQTIETELFVFLTPRVIRSDEDALRVTEPLRAKVDDASRSAVP